MPTRKRRLNNLLKKEIAPFAPTDLHGSGISYIDNSDPVLTYLAMKGEEQWRIMERSESAIYSAKQTRVNALLGAGHEVIEGPSGSPNAIKYKAWAIQFLKRIPSWNSALRSALDAIYWGWRPLEVFWDTNMDFEGQRYWGVVDIREKKPEDFKFTANRDLVYLGKNTGEPIVFDRPEDKLHWLICTSGSTNDPYGLALYRYIWVIYYCKNKFFQMWSQGMERSLGVLKAKEQFTLTEADSTKTLTEIAGELKGVVDNLAHNNILIERNGWTMDFLSDIKFSEAWKHPLEYCDELITLAILGETLTTRLGGSTGSRSAAQVHRQTLMDFVKTDAKELEGWINDQLLFNAFALNFGEIPEEDRPKWKTNVSNPINIENSMILYNMGLPIDGRRLAQATGVPFIADPKPDDLVLLQVQAPVVNPDGSQGSGEDEDMADENSDEDGSDTDDRPRMTPSRVYYGGFEPTMDFIAHPKPFENNDS